MLWQDSTFIKYVPVAGTKSWVTTLVFKEKSVLFVTILLRYNSLQCGTECCSRMAARPGQSLRKKDIYSWL